jgi:hypothetical protein
MNFYKMWCENDANECHIENIFPAMATSNDTSVETAQIARVRASLT